ncbi:MAG: hypothetical protein HQL56_09785 [Magnetococcales bacterium]|nr:hypothetical protein [Magnetococcales bacterium]
MKSLSDLILPDSLQWTDQYDWSPVAQEVGRTLGGTLVTWSQGLQKGRPITLEAEDNTTWLTIEQVQVLQVMAAQPGAVFVLTWGTESWPVIFRHQDPPAISFKPLWPHHDLFTGTLRLMSV